MVCKHCGHENPQGNFFCGRCGSPLFQQPASTGRAPKPGISDSAGGSGSTPVFDRRTQVRATTPIPPAPGPAVVNTEPVAKSAKESISGPSFLGLAETEPVGGEGALDYLYEDEPRRSPARWIVGFVLLAAFGVFLAYQWKQFPNWYTTIVTPLSRSVAPQTAPAANPATEPVASTTAPSPGTTNSQPASAAAPPPSSATPGTPDTQLPLSAAPTTKLSPALPEPLPPASASSVPERDEDNDAPDTATSPAPSRASRAKTSPVRRVEPALDESDQALKKGQAYLYGTGVMKNCNQALAYLKDAAGMGNAKAASQLGGMYATGNCVSLDRAKAYDYFTRAQNAAHGHNVYVQHNREMLWSQMSPAEKARVSTSGMY